MRCRFLFLREWIVGWGVVCSSLVFSPFPLAASPVGAGLPPDRVDAVTASVSLYPDPLLAKLLIAATYPLEVDEAGRWLRKHNSVTGAALDRAIARQNWDDSIKDLTRVPAVLSMMDDRLEWTQNLGDAFLAQPNDVFASVQRLRAMALKARTLRSTSQEMVREEHGQIVIRPAVAQVVDVPFYDPQVAYGKWPHAIYPPMWWTAPRGYVYGSGVGFMTGIGIPAAFWKDMVDWDARRVLVKNAVGLTDYNRVAGMPWIHDPDHRRFVSYSTPELRHHYGRDFPPDRRATANLRGYDIKQEPFAPGRMVQTRAGTMPVRKISEEMKSKPRPSIFQNIGQGASERLFSRRGNASIFAARHDNSHFEIGELAAASIKADTVAAR